MEIYKNKYTLEFDDIIQGEFNAYKLEIHKKYADTTTNNVTVGAINTSGETINQFDPVRVVDGEVQKSKASVSSSMPSTGIATVTLVHNATTSDGILVSGVVTGVPSQLVGYEYYVDVNGGTTNTEPSGTNIVQKIAVQVANTSATILDQIETIKGTNSPIQLNYNLVEDNMLSPFRSSYIDINFYKENLSDDYNELFGAESDSFKVYLYKNTLLFWQGWIGSQLFSEPFSSPPYPIKLRAYDGLHLLKEKLYFDSTDVFQATSNLLNDRYGYHNIVDVIEKCIYNTGVLEDLFYCINIQNSLQVTTSYFFPVLNRVHHQTFLKGESNSMNMEEVLKNVLKSLGATIYQRDGNWCIVRISDFTLKANPLILKRNTWRSDSTTDTNYITTDQSTGSVSDVSSNVNFLKVDGEATMTMQYPLKEVVIEQEFDHNMILNTTIDMVKDLGSQDPSGTFLFDEWEASGTNIQEAVVLTSRDNFSQNKPISKSFIEADLGSDSIQLDYCDSSLYYPSSHLCTVDSSTMSGLKAESKIRPLGRNLLRNEQIGILMSPKLYYTISSTDFAFGFGKSALLFSIPMRTDNIQNEMINRTTLRIKTAAFAGGGLRIGSLQVTCNDSFTVSITKDGSSFFNSTTIPAGGAIFGRQSSSVQSDFDITASGDYDVTVTTNGGIALVQWKLEGLKSDLTIWGEDYYSSYNDTSSFQYTEGFAETKDTDNEQSIGAAAFGKEFNCSSAILNLDKANFVSNKLNNWNKFEITASEIWNSNITNLYIQMHLFGAAKITDNNESTISSPYSNTYDVSYSNPKLLPIVTNSKIVPSKQEYIITQSGNFSNKIRKEVKIGSGLFNVGSKRYITFTDASGNTAEKSWHTFRDSRGSSVGQGVENATLQHLVGASYMELYRISVRRLDGTHYGNYKYGDMLQPIVNGAVDTVNGTRGKFFPMNVEMDLKMARIRFSGDDLINNSGSDWQSTLTKTIKWIGEDDMSEIETLS